MITDEEVLRLFERADPAPRDETTPVVDAAAYLAALEARRTDVTIVELETDSSEPGPDPVERSHSRRWIVAAAAAVAGVALVGGLLIGTSKDKTTHVGPVTSGCFRRYAYSAVVPAF